MPLSRQEQLNQIGFVWDPFTSDWDEGFSYLIAYKNREGHCRVPKDHIENGFKLGAWIATQRPKIGSMPVSRRERLEEIGFVWNARDASWEGGFSYLKAYKEREGDCRVPDGFCEDGFPLGQWVSVQRARKPLRNPGENG